ncbi:MAG: DUF1572 family protein [Ginsengibacter sp.]
MPFNYLESVIKYFRQQKSLGDKTIEQLTEENLLWQFNENSNSIAIIVNHLWGNMLSRWSNFLTEDGEKDWRNRDTEFEKVISSKEELIKKWNEGWQCVLDALESLKEEDLSKTIFIRKEAHNVGDAINRQLAHYSNHVGQIVYIGKMVLDEKWKSLSIPKGKSKDFNNKMMSGK